LGGGKPPPRGIVTRRAGFKFKEGEVTANIIRGGGKGGVSCPENLIRAFKLLKLPTIRSSKKGKRSGKGHGMKSVGGEEYKGKIAGGSDKPS